MGVATVGGMHERAGRRRRGRLFALALLAPVALAGCGGGDPDDAPLLDAAVHVEATGCRQRPTVGSGSFVDDGLVLTVAHVVAGSDEVRVELADGTTLPATVVGMDRIKDLAVLRVDHDSIPLRAGRARTGDRGEFVVWRDGKAVADDFSVITFVDIKAMDIDHTQRALRKGFQITARVDHGDSGSLLVVDDRAVGVVFARSTGADDRAWATDIQEAAPLLAAADGGPVDVGECAGG